MYGKWVTVNLGDSIECKVWVSCVPSISEGELQLRALSIIKNRLPEKKEEATELRNTVSLTLNYYDSEYKLDNFDYFNKKLKEIMSTI